MVTVPVWVQHELQVTFNASHLVGRYIFESSLYFFFCCFDYVQNQSVHDFLWMLNCCVLLDLFNYCSEALKVRRDFFLLKVCLSPLKDFVLLLLHSFLVSRLLVSYFLLAATRFFMSALGAPLSSSKQHVNSNSNLLLGYKGSRPFVVEATMNNYLEVVAHSVNCSFDCEAASVLLALAFNCMVDFNTVVANI